jgi:fatty acid desaturase
MANALRSIGVALLVVFTFGPWVLLLVDGIWLFFTGHVLTSIPWDHDVGWLLRLLGLC